MNDTVFIPEATQHPTSSKIFADIVLYDGSTTYTVSKDFYDAVLEQVKDIIPALIHGERYTTKRLCGEAFWSLLSDGEKRAAGKCMTSSASHKFCTRIRQYKICVI